MNTTADFTPRVWIGSLGLYNAGFLIGRWFDATDCPTEVGEWLADPEITAQIGPKGATFMQEVGEELWVFDHENFGPLLTGECSPAEAAKLAEIIESVEEWQRDAFLAWVGTGDYVSDVDGPSVSDFEERYCGEFDSEEDFAQDLAESMGNMPTQLEWPLSYIDWERATRDLFMDYASAPAPGGGVFVFRCS